MKKAYWQKRRVLVTGFDGFLGGNLTRKLITMGACVTGLGVERRRKDTILSKEDYAALTVVKGDVADSDLVIDVCQRQKIQDIFHLAAETIVSKCQQNPLKSFKTNIMGTLSVLEAGRLSGHIKSIIVASSDKAYGAHKNLPYTEKAPLIANHPYDVSKSCADLLAQTYAYTYGVPVAITRCGNLYGPGDFNFSRIVPDGVRCLLEGRRLVIRSDGKFTRDYVYVEDAVGAYMLLAEKLQPLKLHGQAFNFSSENPITVLHLVEEMYRIGGKKADCKVLNKCKYEIKHQYLDSSKARKILEWRPVYSLEDGLRNTIQWYRNNLA